MEINKVGNNMNSLLAAAMEKKVSSKQVAEDKAKKDFAKNYESLVLNKLFESVQKSMSESGFGDDAGAGQVQGMYWMFLSQSVADNGGLGLADQIYKSLNPNDDAAASSSIDHKV